MKLLIVCSQYPPKESPESAHTMLLAEHLAASGAEVCLLTSKLLSNAPDPKGYFIDDSVKSWDWKGLPNIFSAIRRFCPDRILLIYIDWIYGCHPMITFLPGVLRWACPNTQIVTQFENVSGLGEIRRDWGRLSKSIFTFCRILSGWKKIHPEYGSLLSRSKAIIALSKHHAEAFIATGHVSGERVRVIPAPPLLRMALDVHSGAARLRGRELLGAPTERIVIGYFGYIYPMKGIDTLLRAFSLLQGEPHLVIIGSGDPSYVAELHALAEEFGISKRIVWLGHCSPDEIASTYIASLDICVLPFRDGVRLNNSSFSVIASHGIPVVTTRGELLEPEFVDGINVKLCRLEDAHALAEAVQVVIDDSELRLRLSYGATELALGNFSWSHVVCETIAALD